MTKSTIIKLQHSSCIKINGKANAQPGILRSLKVTFSIMFRNRMLRYIGSKRDCVRSRINKQTDGFDERVPFYIRQNHCLSYKVSKACLLLSGQ